jgi:hypothetical protein
MQTSAMRKVDELSPEFRHAVEDLLGRALDGDETVRVSVSKAGVVKEALKGEEKLAAARKLTELLNQIQAGVPELPPEEIDELVDEAIAYARRHRR